VCGVLGIGKLKLPIKVWETVFNTEAVLTKLFTGPHDCVIGAHTLSVNSYNIHAYIIADFAFSV
jgi:hypothetical protein